MSAAPKRLSLVWLILASLVVALLGFVSMGLWMPAVMMFDAPGSMENAGLVAFALYSSAGPVAALLALVVGWVRVAMGRRASGLKWMLVLPVLWLVGLVGWIVAAASLCGGALDCAA